MPEPLTPAPEAPPWVNGPGYRTRSLIVLILRLGLGVQLLNSGVAGFYVSQLATNAGPSWGRGYPRTGIYPGTESAYQFLPYLEIVTALAVLLGFFTVVAAAAAAFQSLAPALFQSVVLLGSGLSTNPNGYDMLFVQSLAHGTMIMNITVAAAVIWLAASGGDGWSLDALMFAPRRAARRDRKAAKTASGTTWPAAAPEPGDARPPAVPFDPSVAVGGPQSE